MKQNPAYHKSSNQIEEEYLEIQKAQKNMKFFNVLYDRYYVQIFQFVYKRVKDEYVAKDIVSQVFVKAMSGLKKYKFKGLPFSSWLHRIAINETNAEFRKNSKNREVNVSSDELHFLSNELAEESRFDEHELIEALKELKLEEIEIIELKYFENRSYKELAQIFNKKENALKVRAFRILKKLKVLLEQKEMQRS